jgi:hypothetical protein
VSFEAVSEAPGREKRVVINWTTEPAYVGLDYVHSKWVLTSGNLASFLSSLQCPAVTMV